MLHMHSCPMLAATPSSRTKSQHPAVHMPRRLVAAMGLTRHTSAQAMRLGSARCIDWIDGRCAPVRVTPLLPWRMHVHASSHAPPNRAVGVVSPGRCALRHAPCQAMAASKPRMGGSPLPRLWQQGGRGVARRAAAQEARAVLARRSGRGMRLRHRLRHSGHLCALRNGGEPPGTRRCWSVELLTGTCSVLWRRCRHMPQAHEMCHPPRRAWRTYRLSAK